MIGWYLFRYNMAGYLFWGMNVWRVDPWRNPPGREDHARRGVFYYPDPGTGMPLPTLRLESVRRGFEDYQYLQLVAEAARQGRIPPQIFKRLESRMLSLTTKGRRNLFPGKVSWIELENLRLEMGEALDRAFR
jgi:hypothetical protein